MRRRCVLAAICMALVLTACGKGDTKYTEQGYSCVINQNYTEAFGHFDQALLAGEDSEMVYRGIGLAYMGTGEYAKAISSFRTALSYADMEPEELEYDINYYMAICYYKLGEFDKAVSVYDAIIDILPKDKEAYFLRGSMKLYLADIEGATKDFDKAAKVDKDDYSTYIDIYEVMINQGYNDEAQKYMDVVLSADNDKISNYDKARLCYFKGDYKRGANFLETERSGKKANADLIKLLGECYMMDGNNDYAAAVYSGYVETNKDPEIFNQLGLCYSSQGDYEMALAAFQKGLEITENNNCMQALKLNEIACYENMYDFTNAKLKLEEYLAEYPGDERLEKEYEFLTTR